MFLTTHNNQKGFTLVEMIISLAIFTIVAVVAIGAFMKITDANRKSQTLKTTINNLQFTLESISREMRVGSSYYCVTAGPGFDLDPATLGINQDTIKTASNCDTTGAVDGTTWIVAFKSSNTGEYDGAPGTCNLVYAYWLKRVPNTNNITIQKSQQKYCNSIIGDTSVPAKSSAFIDLVAPDVKFTGSIMKINRGASEQSKAFMWFKGYSGERLRERTEFELQTTVSERSSSSI